MKGYVVLAMLLLVPTTAYHQIRVFSSRLGPRLGEAVEAILAREGVNEPRVEMQYLDATISGLVESEERREAVAGRVAEIPGVRMLPHGNRLESYGSLSVIREGGVVRVEGVIPPDFVLRLPMSVAEQGEWEEDIKRRELVRSPVGAAQWGSFLVDYFRGPGDRGVRLHGGELKMWGDATEGLRADWLAKASGVVGKEHVSEGFSVYPSLYHLPGYKSVSMRDAAGLNRLRAALVLGVVEFEAGSAEISEAGAEKLAAVAKEILTVGDQGRYVVGGHAGNDGDATENGVLCRKRAEAVVQVLEGNGVPPELLEAASFGAGGDEGNDNRVEILVK